MKKDQSFGIIAVYKDNLCGLEYLIINQKSWGANSQTSNSEMFRGFPKGHAETGESEIMAAKREFIEEVGIEEFYLLGDKHFDASYSFYRGGDCVQKNVRYRIAQVQTRDVKIQEEELNGYKWASFDVAMKILSHRNNKDLLKKVNKYILDGNLM